LLNVFGTENQFGVFTNTTFPFKSKDNAKRHHFTELELSLRNKLMSNVQKKGAAYCCFTGKRSQLPYRC